VFFRPDPGGTVATRVPEDLAAEHDEHVIRRFALRISAATTMNRATAMPMRYCPTPSGELVRYVPGHGYYVC
jgi:hypothetical protein